MHCLWLTLADPDPATNGQLIYSKGLIEAARDAGATLRVIGLARRENPRIGMRAARHRLAVGRRAGPVAVAPPAVAPCPSSPTAAMGRT